MYFTQMFQVINLLLEFGNNLFFARLNNKFRIIKEELLMVETKNSIISITNYLVKRMEKKQDLLFSKPDI